jgi:hypothetical protein
MSWLHIEPEQFWVFDPARSDGTLSGMRNHGGLPKRSAADLQPSGSSDLQNRNRRRWSAFAPPKEHLN